MDEDFLKTLFVEFIEVLIHQIIKLKRLYPDGIYGKRRKYNLTVFMSEHPLVNEFIKEITKGINNQLSDPEADIEAVVLVISRGNKTDQKFRLAFPGFKSLKIETDPDQESEQDPDQESERDSEQDPDQDSEQDSDQASDAEVDAETYLRESLELNFASVLLRLAEVLKDQREAGKEDGEKREWWVQVESAVPGQTDRGGVIMSVIDFEEPFPFQLDMETYR